LDRQSAIVRDSANRGRDFEDVVLPHADAAHRLARDLSRDKAAADDIAQEALLRAFRAFKQYRGGDARGWLLAIVRNCSFDWANAQRMLSQSLIDPDHVADVVHDTPERALLRASEIDELWASIRKLPEPFRQTLVLRELEGFSYREIAKLTGCPVGTVTSRLVRARQMLSSGLRKNHPGRPIKPKSSATRLQACVVNSVPAAATGRHRTSAIRSPTAAESRS
jgi:RNA polymerase sigma-70 factor (ECF subfamily)